MENIYKNIKAADTVIVCPKASILHAITVNATASGTITVLDGVTEVAILKADIAEGTYFFDVVINGALSVVTGSTNNITVSYRVTT